MPTESLDVRIRDKDYRVSCSPEERPALDAALQLLETRLDQVAQRTRSSGEKLAMMVALNLAHEVIAQQTGSVDAQASQRKIEAIEAKLDAVFEARQQNDLF